MVRKTLPPNASKDLSTATGPDVPEGEAANLKERLARAGLLLTPVLYLHVGEPQAAEGEGTPEGHVVRYAPGTSRVVGLTVLGARELLDRDGHVAVTVPETVETTADQLAPALAAS